MKAPASFFKALSAATIGAGMIANVTAANLLESGFDSGAEFIVVGDDDSDATFGFDYSALGIPAAPNGSDTIGLRLASNITAPNAAAGVSVGTKAQFSGAFQAKFDFWLNYHTSGGTTEYGGGGVGFSTAGAPLNGLQFVGDTDGDSSTDYLLLDGGATVGFDSGSYSVFSLNNSVAENDDLQAAFPSSLPPQKQTDDFGQTQAASQPGSLGFGWHTMTLDVDGSGQATFTIDNTEFGSLSGSTDGSIAVTHWDRFSSVAGNENLAFGVYDNLVVSEVAAIPEPSSTLLVGLAGLFLVGSRRRK